MKHALCTDAHLSPRNTTTAALVDFYRDDGLLACAHLCASRAVEVLWQDPRVRRVAGRYHGGQGFAFGSYKGMGRLPFIWLGLNFGLSFKSGLGDPNAT